MRFLLDEKSYQEMHEQVNSSDDCFVRPGEYLHHIYYDGVKYIVAKAVIECLRQAQQANDQQAVLHLALHKRDLDTLLASQKESRTSPGRLLGDPPPHNQKTAQERGQYVPPAPQNLAETGLTRSFHYEIILRTVYNLGRPTGSEITRSLGIPYQVLGGILQEMRQKELLDIAGQSGVGEMNYEYILKPPRGHQAAEDALRKSEYFGPAPVPFEMYLHSVDQQTIRSLAVTRQNIRQSFRDLVLSESTLNEIGPAINSADSIFLFGAAGNGKTSIAERITRLLGDEIYIPYALESDGQIIKLYDPTVHVSVQSADTELVDFDIPFSPESDQHSFDRRWIKIKRPTIIVGGELTLSMLDLAYNQHGRFYEAPLQMKANNGIFMIDDFGRQLVRPLDLLNRWIVPLEKHYDFLSTVTGTKLQMPFDVLLIFSTNLDPNQLADEAFLRRIKYKIEIKDPDESQWRQIWKLVCQQKKVQYDPRALDYLLQCWYQPYHRPLRACHPRDLLNQMISIAAYNMEKFSYSPDLIDAACHAYFIIRKDRNF